MPLESFMKTLDLTNQSQTMHGWSKRVESMMTAI